MAAQEVSAVPDGIFSLLDTDLYKLTMQCAVHQYYPDTPVTYHFTNRTPAMKLSKEAFAWLEVQVGKLANLALTPDELAYLKATCGYLDRSDYLTTFLPQFRLDPDNQVVLKFHDDPDHPGLGDVELDVRGLWQEVIIYEIPLLALVSEAYFKFVDTDWSHEGQEAAAYDKAVRLIEGGAIFSEFGTRRRRDHKTHDLVMAGLARANRELVGGEGSTTQSGVATSAAQVATQAATAVAAAVAPGLVAGEGDGKRRLGRLSGTSNVHMARRHGVPPVGTMAHEWFMGIAAATQDYAGATALALTQWIECFGRGVLGIALTDTFGTPAFLDGFREPVPASMRGLTEGWLRRPPSFAEVFVGVRQDSGDPRKFVRMMRRFYDAQDIAGRKSIVFSDSLNVDNALLYMRKAEKRGFNPSFGIGTFLTNDFERASDGEKSKPLNIVIKLSSANDHPAIKLSDDLGKNTGDGDTVKEVKEEFGYVDKHWNGADEADRYGKGTIGDDLSDSSDDE